MSAPILFEGKVGKKGGGGVGGGFSEGKISRFQNEFHDIR